MEAKDPQQKKEIESENLKDADASNPGMERDAEFAFEGEGVGFFSRFFPSARRIFSNLGLNRCSVL
jgi:hypothetical protein